MKLPDDNMPRWMEERVEAYLDGVLPPDEEARFEQLLDEDASWQGEVDLACRIQNELHALPEPSCPPRITHAILERANASPSPSIWKRMAAWWNPQPFWQPALAAGLALVLVVLSALLIRPVASPERPSQTEVKKAAAEVKWTLAYLAHVGKETSEKLQQDVKTHVAAPLLETLDEVHEQSETSEP